MSRYLDAVGNRSASSVMSDTFCARRLIFPSSTIAFDLPQMCVSATRESGRQSDTRATCPTGHVVFHAIPVRGERVTRNPQRVFDRAISGILLHLPRAPSLPLPKTAR